MVLCAVRDTEIIVHLPSTCFFHLNPALTRHFSCPYACIRRQVALALACYFELLAEVYHISVKVEFFPGHRFKKILQILFSILSKLLGVYFAQNFATNIDLVFTLFWRCLQNRIQSQQMLVLGLV